MKTKKLSGLPIKKCVTCNDEFTPWNNRARFCSATCRKVDEKKRREGLPVKEREPKEIDFKGYAKILTDDGKALLEYASDLVNHVRTLPVDAPSLRSFKGVPVTAQSVPNAIAFLTENTMGKAGQRATSVDRDDRPFEEKFKELEYQCGRVGYLLIRKKDFMREVTKMGYEIKKANNA